MAARIVEAFYMPTIMLTTVDGVVRGSARSVVGYDIFAAIRECSICCFNWRPTKLSGSHLELANIQRFADKLKEVVASTITEEMKTPVISINTDLAFVGNRR